MVAGDLSRRLRGVSLGALLLGQLRRLKPGEAFRLSAVRLQDVAVPANPLDRQTPEFLVEWFKIRLPFYVAVRAEPCRQFWDIYRPLPEELERLMAMESALAPAMAADTAAGPVLTDPPDPAAVHPDPLPLRGR